ncbi:hypothetical protein Tco_1261666, partial [Tanacetum coccineum]
LDVYEPRQCYDEYERMFAEAVILIDDRLVKLIDITLEQWLDLKFGDHKKVDKEIMEEVVSTWLIRSYRKQFEEYMEIKRRLEVYGINTDVECDPTNEEFPKRLASKFNNHKTMDWYTKNTLWLYWKRGDDEEVLTYDEFSDLEEESLHEDTEIAEIFRIETDILDFETPLCKEFKEFNHLLQFDADVLPGDLPGFKKYKDYKNAWIYEWNKEVSWIEEKPLLDYGTWKEPNDDICHECKSFQFKIGDIEWPTCNSNEDGYCNGGNLIGMIQVGNMTYFQDYEWYEGLEDGDFKNEVLKEKSILEGSWGHENKEGKNFCSWLKECFSNYQELDYELMRKLEELDQERFDNHEPMEGDDDDIGNLEDYLIPQDASYYVDEEEERFEERKSKLLGIPYEKPPTFKSEKFEVIKYSLGPAEEYVAIKEYEYDIWLRTEENVSRVYQEIFHKKAEG